MIYLFGISLILIFSAVSGGKLPSRIVGGVEAIPHEFPWLVDVRYDGRHVCGGSIITPDWVVTTAACIKADWSVNALYFPTVVAGDHDVTIHGEPTEQKRQTTYINVHYRYGEWGVPHEYDVAIVRVNPPFIFDEYVQPIPLAPWQFVPTENATVAGWGRLTENGESSSKLMKVTVPVISDEKCRESYPGQIADSMLCAGETGKDACNGDGGSPLMCTTENGTTFLCGLVSFGAGCARPGFPGVYTELSHFTGFIQSNLLPGPSENHTFINHNQGCGGVVRYGTSGRLSYKLNEAYQPGERCVWTIMTYSGKDIRIKPLASGLANGDELTITELYSGDAVLTNTTKVGNDQFTVNGAVILVTFRSSRTSPGGTGFSFEFYGTGFPDNTRALHTHLHLNSTYGGVLYPFNGGNYAPNEHVILVIAPEGGKNPTVTINKIDIYKFMDCEFDHLNVLGYSDGKYNHLGKFCEPDLPPPFVATDGVMVFIFKTGLVPHSQQTGFGITWNSN